MGRCVCGHEGPAPPAPTQPRARNRPQHAGARMQSLPTPPSGCGPAHYPHPRPTRQPPTATRSREGKSTGKPHQPSTHHPSQEGSSWQQYGRCGQLYGLCRTHRPSLSPHLLSGRGQGLEYRLKERGSLKRQNKPNQRGGWGADTHSPQRQCFHALRK